MSRQVAIGGVIGFAVTILLMALWERHEAPPAPPQPVLVPAADVFPLPLNQAHPLPLPDKRALPMVAQPRPILVQIADAGTR